MLKGTPVQLDQPLAEGIARVTEQASKELGPEALRPIAAQVETLLGKEAGGVIEAQAAYNVKRALDRIGKGSDAAAFHARELRGELMGALERSLGPEEAAKFATTRRQYGNMRDIEKIIQAGAEGDISIARLAGLRDANPDLQEVVDIAAQFAKSRDSTHSASQRAIFGAGAGLGAGTAAGGPIGGLAGLAGTVAAGRLANTALGSNALRRFALGAEYAPPAGPLAPLAVGIYERGRVPYHTDDERQR